MSRAGGDQAWCRTGCLTLTSLNLLRDPLVRLRISESEPVASLACGQSVKCFSQFIRIHYEWLTSRSAERGARTRHERMAEPGADCVKASGSRSYRR